MSRSRYENVSWDALPEGWVDSTCPLFRQPFASSALGPYIRLAYAPLREGETIRALADRQLEDPLRELPGYALVGADPTETPRVGGRPAVLLRLLLEHRERRRLVVQTSVWVDPMGEGDGQAPLFVAFAPDDAAREVQARFAKVLATVRFDLMDPRAAPPRAPFHDASLPAFMLRGDD